MKEFEKALRDKSFGYVSEIIENSRNKNDVPFIVELKKDELPEVAINQIKEKEYVEKIRRENEGKKVLAVAICYDSKSKEHRCKIEEI